MPTGLTYRAEIHTNAPKDLENSVVYQCTVYSTQVISK